MTDTPSSVDQRPEETPLAIAIQDLRYAYGSDATVLSIDRLEIKAGERVIITGPSGGGKSTLLGLMAGVLAAPPDRVRVLGTDLGRLSPSQRDRFRGEHIGFIFQMFNLIPYLSVGENIALPCRLNPARLDRLSGDSLESAVAAMAERLGIGDLVDRPITRLSVGQQQRAAAARALLGAPRLVLADEPTSALDTVHRDRFIDLLFDCCQDNNATLLFVSHDRSLTPHFDRELRLEEINRAEAAPAATEANPA